MRAPAIATRLQTLATSLRAPRAAAAAACAAGLAACSGGDLGSTGLDASDDFPLGDAFVFGVAISPSGLGVVENVEVVITPDDGLPLQEELESPVQATDLTNRRGEFSFGGIAPGPYVLFVRFDTSFLGVGEVVGRVEATRAPNEVRIAPPFVGLRFVQPRDDSGVAVGDTAVLRFARFTIEELSTLDPTSRPLFARVDVFPQSGGGSGGSGDGGGPGARPVSFEVALDEAATNLGSVRVPLDLSSVSGSLRLEPVLGIHVAYSDPRGPAPILHEIRGEAIQVVRQ